MRAGAEVGCVAMTRSASPGRVTADQRSRRDVRFVAGASERWWKTPEGLETRRSIEEEVWSRHREALGHAGPVARALLKLRIRYEIAAECDRVLWAQSSDPRER